MEVCPQTNTDIRDMQEDILARKLDIDKELLRECQWILSFLEGSIEEVHRENALRYRECFIRHNGLVKTIKIIKGNDIKE